MDWIGRRDSKDGNLTGAREGSGAGTKPKPHCRHSSIPVWSQ